MTVEPQSSRPCPPRRATGPSHRYHPLRVPSLLTPPPVRRTNAARWPVAFALALVGHGLVLALILLLPPAAPSRPGVQQVAMRTVSGAEWARARGEPPQPPRPKAEAAREEKPRGQVVQVAPGNRQRPDDSSFLAETHNRVDRQTRSTDEGELAPRVSAQRTSPSPSQTQGQDPVAAAESAGNDGSGKDAAPASEAGRRRARVELPEADRSDRLAMRTPRPEGQGPLVERPGHGDRFRGTASALRLQEGERELGASASLGSAGPGGGQLNLIPPASVLGSAAGAPRPDALRDVEEGPQTLLNTVMWKHAGFMNRIRDQIYGRWTRNVDAELSLRDPTLTIYLGRERYTILLVAMDEGGAVKNIQVARSSGVDFLDRAAVDAFYAAQPFPAPPAQLARDDGLFVIPFGFTIHRASGGGVVIRSGPPPPRMHR